MRSHLYIDYFFLGEKKLFGGATFKPFINFFGGLVMFDFFV